MPKAKTPQNPFAELFKDLPVDTQAFENAFKSTAALNEKLATAALDAAGAAQDLGNSWTKDTLGKMLELAKAKTEPADYVKAIADVAKDQSDVAVANLTTLADIAKSSQTEVLELLAAASKDMNEDAAKALKAASEKATDATKKLAAAA
ncbi:MAG: phasin family protein [Litoreibacter sp.]|nr:phasin family protein [Litoreibacter sp.]